MRWQCVALVVAALAASACATSPKVDPAAEEQAIRALATKWNDLIARKDVDGIVALYAPDGATVWPDAPASHGTAAIRAAWVELLKTPGVTAKITPERVTVSSAGDMAFDFGRVELGIDTPQGHVNEAVKYVVGWKKVDGAWRAAYDVFNSNAPASPPPAAPATTGAKDKGK